MTDYSNNRGFTSPGASMLAKILLQVSSSSQNDFSTKLEKDKWLVCLIALDLCTDMEKAKKIKKDVMTNKLPPDKALSKMIKEWTEKNGSEDDTDVVLLDKLIGAVSLNGFQQYADDIKNKFLKSDNCESDNNTEKLRTRTGPTASASGDRDAFTVMLNSAPVKKVLDSSMILGLYAMKNKDGGITVLKYFSCFNARPSIVSSSARKALENSVILGEIFKNLGFHERRNFRLVNRLWMEETRALWRKGVWIQFNGEAEPSRLQISLRMFYELFSQQENGEWTEENYGLVRHRFRKFNFYQELLRPFTQPLPEDSRFFWNFYSPQITHLSLQRCSFVRGQGACNFIMGILLEKCPNLEVLHLEACKVDEDEDADYRIYEATRRGPRRQTAEKLKKAVFQFEPYLDAKAYKKIFGCLPNLMDLTFNENTFLRSGLFQTLRKTGIKLKRFKSSTHIFEGNFASLRDYLQQQASTPSLSELELTIAKMEDRERRNLNIGSVNFPLALSQCQALTILKLTYFRPTSAADNTWFTDFSRISLPNLKKFEVNFCKSYRNVKFDFAALRGMPMLESLKILLKPVPRRMGERRPGTKDWICEDSQEENRNLHLNPEEPWTGCGSLRKFVFDGWKLNQEDVVLFHGFFPNVENFGAALDHDTLPLACNTWTTFKNVLLTSYSEKFSMEVLGSLRLRYNIKIDLPGCIWFW